MVSRKDPAFLFSPADWLTDSNVTAMTLEQQGAYLRLLCVAWLEHGLPNDLQRIRALLGLPQRRFDAVWTALADRWVDRDGRLVNRRQEAERAIRRERAQDMRALGQLGGQRSAQARAQANGQARAQPDGEASRSTDAQAALVNPFTFTSTSSTQRAAAPGVLALSEGEGLVQHPGDLARARETEPEQRSAMAFGAGLRAVSRRAQP
jgi:uncharacterized protein YdaU (DUF1376 family)